MINRRRCLMHLGALAGPLYLPASATAREPHPVIWSGVALRFPRDFGAHPEFRTEWWYVTGRLRPDGVTDAAHELGFQVTFFRSRVDTAQDNPSRLAAHQLILAHAAITDVAGRQLLHEQRIAREGMGLAGAAMEDTRVHLRRWSLERRGTPAQSVYQAEVQAQGFALSLSMRSTQPVLLQGEAGYSRKGPLPEQASRYYSQPQLAVQGQVTRQGQTQAVTGRAWMDHEWSEGLLAPEAVGWDWVGMNLHDGSALTVFRLRRADGSALWAGGSFRAAGQVARVFGAGEVRFTAGRTWVSPGTGARYPVEWQVETPVGRYGVRARMDAQELAGQAGSGAVYWEGLSELVDARARVVGEGYLEMTGYVGRLAL